MNRKFILACFLWFLSLAARGQADPPLRVFIRAGEKTHGPDQHDHPRFLREWTELLKQRGYPDADIKGIMYTNWVRFFKEAWSPLAG